MRYYDLDTNGKVKGSYAVPQPFLEDQGITLLLLEDQPSDQHIWNGSSWVQDQGLVKAKQQADKTAEIAATDSQMARITEDLIDTLISKGVIKKTDLPQNVQDKLDNRKKLRNDLSAIQ